MSNEINLRQRRFTASLEGQTYYSIAVSAEPGTNPSHPDRPMDSHVFVQTIADNSFEDAFARIATIADMDLVPTSRDFAVGNNITEYRTASTTLRFSDLDTAIAAVHVLRDRVNNLVDVYVKAVRDFITPSVNTDFPDLFPLPVSAEVLSVKQGLINSYIAARDSRASEEADMAIVQDDYDTKLLAFQCETEKKDIHCDYQSKLSDIKSGTTSLAGSLLQGVTALESAAEAASRSKVFKYDSSNLSGSSLSGQTWTTLTVSKQGQVLGTLFPDADVGDLIEVTYNGATHLRAIIDHGESIQFAPPIDPAPPEGTQFKIYSILGAFSFSDSGQLAGKAAALRSAYDTYIGGSNSLSNKISDISGEADTECAAAQTTTSTAWAAAESSKELLQAKEAAVAQAQKAETVATAELLAYCPTIDLSSL